MDRITKKQKVYNFMKTHEFITSMDAFRLFNETRLAAVVWDLRKHGVLIRTEKVRTKDSTPYARYYLEDK